MTYALQLIEIMNESTLHYAIETITASLKLYGFSIINQDLCIQISQMGLKVLSLYSTDPLLLDVTKDMLITLIDMKGGQGVGVVYNVFGAVLRGWIVSNNTNNDPNSDLGDCNGEVYSSGGNAPPSLIEVGIDILGAICVSAFTLLDDEQDNNISHIKEAVLSCLDTLFSVVNTHQFPCRRESIQTINTIFSKYRRKILSLFNSSSPQLAIQQFSQTLSVIIIQALQGIKDDCTGRGDTSGPISGLLCHFLLIFQETLDISIINQILSLLLDCLNSHNSYVKHSLVMCLIHLFSRNTMLPAISNPGSPLFRVLSFIPTSPPSFYSPYSFTQNHGNSIDSVNALSYVLDFWCYLHIHLNSRYNGVISSLGLIQLIKLFSVHCVNHGFALKAMQLLLSTLPRMLLTPTGEDDEVAESNYFEDDDYSEGSYEEEWGSEEDEGDYEDEMEGEDQEDFLADKGKETGPFAPAEMYLSDMLNKDNDDDGVVIVNISDHLIFSPPSLDPLASSDLQGHVIAMLLSLHGIDNMFPSWMAALSVQDQQLIQALVASR